MTVISLLQPWASLVILGYKTIETRSWSTAYRGELMIHASQGKSGMGFCDQPIFKKYLRNVDVPFGAIIGVVSLDSIIQITDLALSDSTLNEMTLEEKIFGDYTTSRFAWILRNPLPLDKPIPARGYQRLWQYHFK